METATADKVLRSQNCVFDVRSSTRKRRTPAVQHRDVARVVYCSRFDVHWAAAGSQARDRREMVQEGLQTPQRIGYGLRRRANGGLPNPQLSRTRRSAFV